MRASVGTRHVALEPGRAATLDVEVTNTSEVIDGVSATIDWPGPERPGGEAPWSGGAGPERPGGGAAWSGGPAGLDVRSNPPLLPLFPDGTGVIRLELKVSATFAAGTYTMAVLVRSSVHLDDTVLVPVEVEVKPAPSAALQALPPVRAGRHKATYRMLCDNTGNVPLDVSLAASDPERAVQSHFSPATLAVAPGSSAAAEMAVRTRRHFFGGDITRTITVVGTAGAVDVDTRASFRQRPIIPRGLRTVLVLGTIIALWAAVFVIAIDKALTKDKLTKDVPPSFYAASAASANHPANGGSGPLRLSADANAPPAGAVPKSGVVIGVGGTITGTVTAQSTGSGIGRITVEAIDDTPDGPQLVSSAASGTDGSYSLVGLLPGPYKLLFTAQGYQDVWYPSAADEQTAKPVNVNAQTTTPGINATITGSPGSITGKVDTGQTPQVPVTVTVLPGQGSTTPIDTVTTDANGNYTIPNLPAPGTYDLGFSAPGYEAASDTEQLAGGENRIAGTTFLTAGPGTLGGTVTDGTNPLGGVTITANANGQTITSATPTTGAVGQFTIPNLTTPATYLLTFSKSGYGTQTLAEHLGPGQQLTNLSIVMAGGAGQVTGTVTAPGGQPLGGVSVTVAGGQSPVTTQTLTAGAIGTYELSGLATPGNYTLTFSLAGYQSQTLGVTLSSSGAANGINVTLPVFSGAISGTVSGASGPLTGVAVSATNGTTPAHTTVTSSSPPGGYSLTGLAPGSWSVTFSVANCTSQTVLVNLQPGQTANEPVSMSCRP